MFWQSFLFFVILLGVIHSAIEIYDYVLVKKGAIPSKSEATLEDVKNLRDSGKLIFAFRRFRAMPENRGKYTIKGAREAIRNL